MLTMMTIRTLDEGTQRAIEQALIVLARSKVLLLEIESQQQQIMNRFDDADETELAKQVLKIREQSRVMRGIHQLGEQIAKERGVS